VYRYGLAPANPDGGRSHGGNVFHAMDGGSQSIAKRIFLFTTICADQDQDAAGNSGIAQRHAFVG
jgi:hypothetical protein